MDLILILLDSLINGLRDFFPIRQENFKSTLAILRFRESSYRR